MLTERSFVQQEQTAYGLFSADLLLNSAVVVPATLLQIRILRSHAIHGARAVDEYLQGGRNSSHAKMLTSRSDQMRRTVTSLALEAALVLIATLAIVRLARACRVRLTPPQTSVSTWVASNLRSVLSTGRNIEAAYSIVYITSGAFGIPINALILRRCVRLWRKKRALRSQLARKGAVAGACAAVVWSD